MFLKVHSARTRNGVTGMRGSNADLLFLLEEVCIVDGHEVSAVVQIRCQGVACGIVRASWSLETRFLASSETRGRAGAKKDTNEAAEEAAGYQRRA